MSDMESPTEPTNRWTFTASCVCVCVQQQRCQPKNICLLQNQPQNIHPEVTVREEGFPFWPPPFLAHGKGGLQLPGGHAPHSPSSPACGPRCSGNSCCSPRCPGSSHGRGQRSREGPPGCRRRTRSSALPCEEEEEEMCHCFNETLWTHARPWLLRGFFQSSGFPQADSELDGSQAFRRMQELLR